MATNLDEQEVKSDKYYTFINMNKPVFFWGFTSIQLIGSVGITVILAIVAFVFFPIYIAVFVLVGAGVPLVWAMGKIRTENAKGNPNYLESYFLWKETPRRVTDNENILSIIYKTEDKDNGNN